MKTQDITDKTIRGYLLGTLEDKTMESFDERSISDQEFADRVAVEEYELVDDWISGRLESAEKHRFEVVLARSPALREKALISRTMAAAHPAAVVVERLPEPALFQRLFSGFPRLAFGLAAAVVLGAVAGLLVFLRPGPVQEISMGEPQEMQTPPIATNAVVTPSPEVSPVPPTEDPAAPNSSVQAESSSNLNKRPRPASRVPRVPSYVALLLSPPTRGSNEIRSIRIEDGVEYLDLTVMTETESKGPFRIEIGDASSGASEWTSRLVSAAEKDGRTSLRVRVPTLKLGAGLRAVRLRQAGTAGTVIDEHVIRVVR